MPYEIREQRDMALSTTVKPKYEILDLNGSTTFEITSSTYQLKLVSTNTVILSGSCTVDNLDVDAAGNTIKTVQMSLDLSSTGVVAGYYTLCIRVTLSTGETDDFRIPVRVVDYQEA